MSGESEVVSAELRRSKGVRGEQKRHPLMIRFDELERELIHVAAREAGCTTNLWCRETLLDNALATIKAAAAKRFTNHQSPTTEKETDHEHEKETRERGEVEVEIRLLESGGSEEAG